MKDEEREVQEGAQEQPTIGIVCGFTVLMLETGGLHVQVLTPEENQVQRPCADGDVSAMCQIVNLHQQANALAGAVASAGKPRLTIPGNGNGNPMQNRLRQMFGRKGHR